MKIKLPQRNKKFKKGGSSVKPDLYWRVILGLSSLLIVSSFAYGFVLFLETGKEEEPEIEISGVREKNIQKKLEEALYDFAERERKSSETLSSPTPIPDPSK